MCALADLDEEEIQRTVDIAVQLGRLEPPRERDTEALLRGFDLLSDGHLLNAAVVLFGKASHLFSAYPQCLLQVARFRGINRLADFADNRMFTGNLFELLQQAERFLVIMSLSLGASSPVNWYAKIGLVMPRVPPEKRWRTPCATAITPSPAVR